MKTTKVVACAKEKGIGGKAAGCRVAPRQRSRIEAPGGHSPIAPETGASIRPGFAGTTRQSARE